MQKRNPGFSLVVIIGIVLVIAIAGYIGWSVYQANSQKSSNTQANNSQNSNSSNTNQSTNPTNTAKYLNIKEFGVRIKLGKDIEDAVYYYDTSIGVVRVSTQRLIDLSGGECNPQISSPFGNLRKTTEVNQPDGSVLKANGVNVFQFESSYIVYSTPTQTCSTDSKVTEIQTPQLQSFKEALKTMESL